MTAQPCPLGCDIGDPNCTVQNARADPAPDNAQQGAREGDDLTVRAGYRLAKVLRQAGDETTASLVFNLTQSKEQLAAQDAEIARLKPLEGRLMEMVGRAVVGVSLAAQSDVDEYQKIASQYGDLIAALTDALRKVKSAIENENGLNSLSIVCTVWVSEIETAVDFIDEAVAAAETMMGEKKKKKNG